MDPPRVKRESGVGRRRVCETMLRYALTTLGCKVNQYDGAALAAALRRKGFRPAGPDPRPTVDLVVINTCCITSTAMRKSRQAIRRALRDAPGANVLVVGCYCDYAPEAIGALLTAVGSDRRAIVCGHHGDLAASVEEVARSLVGRRAESVAVSARPDQRVVIRNDQIMSAGTAGHDAAACGTDSLSIIERRRMAVKEKSPGAMGLGPIDRFDDHQRAFVKIQDGCDAFCAYCIVPYTRPRLWSRGGDEVVAECEVLVAAGHREIVLAGVFLGAYGRSTARRGRWGSGDSPVGELVRRVAGIDGLWRVRLSSLEPGDLTDGLIDICRSLPNFAPHFHLPLQSGARRILRAMGRQYTPDAFRRTVYRVRAGFDRPALTTDIIVGFPGETDEDFADTCDLARQVGFAKIHAFPFSPVRPTAAWKIRHQAPRPELVKRRMAELAELEAQTAQTYRRQFVGQTLEALVEAPRIGAHRARRAMTDRYLTVRFQSPDAADADAITGQVVNLHIDETTPTGLAGTLRRSAGPAG